MCECEVCKKSQVVRQKLALLPESERDFWHNMYDDLITVEMDLSYYKSIVDGSWPDADRIIALRRTPKPTGRSSRLMK